MSLATHRQNQIWPCFSCCEQIWIPSDATFGDGCPGIVSHIPLCLAVLVLLGRYTLRPLWRKRSVWLRGFATEADELRQRKGGRSSNDDSRNSDTDDPEADGVDTEVAVAVAVGFHGALSSDAATTSADGGLNDGDDASSGAHSTIVDFGRRSSIVGVRPVSIGGGFVSLKVRAWRLMTGTVFLLSVAGVVTSLSMTLAAGLGVLFWTPLVPCLVSCLILAIDCPRTLSGAVLFLHSSTIFVQLTLLFGVPDLARWPMNLAWLAEMSVCGLSVGLLLAMPMRDPHLGAGSPNNRIATLFETPSSRCRSPEDNLTLWQWMTVNWMAPIIGLGATRQLHDDDVWHLPFEFQHARLYGLFHDVTGSVTARILKVNTPDLIITSLLGVMDSILSMSPIILLKQMLAAIEDTDPNVRVAVIYAVFIFLTNIARAQAAVFSLWFSRRCYERSRGELITMIYEKTLRRKAFTFPGIDGAADDKQHDSVRKSKVGGGRGSGGGSGSRTARTGATGEITKSSVGSSAPASTGKILNLMRNDVYEVAQRFWEFPSLLTKPLNFFLSIFLLWHVLGGASLLGILVVVLAQVINALLIRILVRWEVARRAVTDIKLQVTSQFIESIRHLRWYDWQDRWLNDILSARSKELRYRVITNVIQKCIYAVNQLAASFFPVAAFYAFTVFEGRPLTVDVAFPALNLFNLLEQSLRELPDLVTVLLNANVAMRRIEAFMAEPNKEDGDSDGSDDVLKPTSADLVVRGIVRSPGPLLIEIKASAFSWPAIKAPVLSRVNFKAQGAGLTVIYGKVGTGKTALLLAILGEMDQLEGSRLVPKETIGYCAQMPWLQSMTVRENILFCLPYDEERYNRVIDACCLLPDFAEFEDGDLSSIGENGIGLSGGQKARVALARAVYSRARILLLDDPIAALDHNTAEAIMKRLFLMSGLMRDRLVVFATHRMDLTAAYADHIYEVSNEHGIVTEVDVDSARQSSLAGEPYASSTTADEESEGSTVAENVPHAEQAHDTPPSKFIEEEHRAQGGVMLSVYWRYLKAGGLLWWLTVIMVFVGFRVTKIAYLYFLKMWGEAYEHGTVTVPVFGAMSSAVVYNASSSTKISWSLDDNFGLPSPSENVRPWLFWFTVLAMMSVVLRTAADLLLIVITYMAGKQVFQRVVMRVSTAPFRFFDVTPVGRLMNRVTSDIGTVDGAIAQQIHRCAWLALNWISSIIIIASATPTFLVMVVFMTAMFVLIFFRFLPASQSLRRLEMVSLSPLMSNFGTLLEGLTTVRAFRVQPHFQERIIVTTDAFQRMDHFYWSLQAWLTWRFNVLTALSTFALTMTALATGLSSGLVAFVLTAAAYFVNTTQALCRRYGELQMQFVSVERVMELLDLDEEPVGTVDPPAAWPTSDDDILFENVTIRYAPHLEPSLRGITMRIPAGSTVAVTGRTGSGKSTLALALLGIVLADDNATTRGRIYIGSMNVAAVNKHALRQRISFVAQDPVLFPGTLRLNLDPIGEHTDAECEAVLQHVLGDVTGDLTLSSRVDGGGKNMSQGQRQLIGLGRAVLRRSPIVVLDEATASIDKKTALRIQKVLREELRHSTVITIAHRVEAVQDADFSVVLENGRLVHAGPVEHCSTAAPSTVGVRQ